LLIDAVVGLVTGALVLLVVTLFNRFVNRSP